MSCRYASEIGTPSPFLSCAARSFRVSLSTLRRVAMYSPKLTICSVRSSAHEWVDNQRIIHTTSGPCDHPDWRLNNRQVFRRNSYERVTTDYQIARALRSQRPADLANPRYTPE